MRAAVDRARTLVLAPPLDLFNPAEAARHGCGDGGCQGRVEIPSVQGHQAASALEAEDAAFLNAEIGRFLATPHPSPGSIR